MYNIANFKLYYELSGIFVYKIRVLFFVIVVLKTNTQFIAVKANRIVNLVIAVSFFFLIINLLLYITYPRISI